MLSKKGGNKKTDKWKPHWHGEGRGSGTTPCQLQEEGPTVASDRRVVTVSNTHTQNSEPSHRPYTFQGPKGKTWNSQLLKGNRRKSRWFGVWQWVFRSNNIEKYTRQVRLYSTLLLYNKDTIQRMRRRAANWKKIFARDICDDGLLANLLAPRTLKTHVI